MARREASCETGGAAAARPLAALAFALSLASTAAYLAFSEGVRNFVAALGAAATGG